LKGILITFLFEFSLDVDIVDEQELVFGSIEDKDLRLRLALGF
jgi:hypothetical protein